MSVPEPSENLFADGEVRAFVDSAPRRWTYSEVAARCREKFGRERAWPKARIVAYFLASNRLLRGKPFNVMRDPEVLAFVNERIARVPYTALADECRSRFGRKRAPSRAALHRYAEFLRRLHHGQ
jgi:hypothetical protein